MLEAAGAVGDATAALNDSVDDLGAAVGVEVGQQRSLPAAQDIAQPRDLGDRSVLQGGDKALVQLTSRRGDGLVEHVAEALSALVGRTRPPCSLSRGRLSGPCATGSGPAGPSRARRSSR